MKKTLLLILVLLVLVSACTPETKDTAEIVVDSELRNEFSQLFAQLDFKQVRSLFEEKRADGLTDPVALQSYWFVEYKIFEDYDNAKAILEEVIRLGSEEEAKVHGAQAMGEMFLAQGEYNAAIRELKTAAAHYGDVTGWDDTLSRLYFLLGRSYRGAEDNANAIGSLEASMQYNPYRSEASKLLHQLLVEDGNYQRAYEVWKIENYIVEGADPYLPSAGHFNDLYEQALAKGAGHKEMAELFSTLRLYDEALVEYSRAEAENGTDPDVAAGLTRVKTFIEFRDELVAFFHNYYRERCQGGAEFNNYQQLVPIYSKIAPMFGSVEMNSPKSWVSVLNNMIEEEFGVGLEFAMDSGVLFGLNFGYEAEDIRAQVTQWGSTGEFRLIVLKNMVSNGLTRWLTDGTSGVGGWTSDKMFVALDSSGSLLSNLSYLDPEYLDSVNQQGTQSRAGLDDKDPLDVFYSPVLGSELRAKQITVEKDRAIAAGIDLGFLETYIANRLQKQRLNNTVIHEGQHALDLYFPSTWFGEMEYRAKLSELAYDEMQYRNLAGYSDAKLGQTEDKHSAANTRVFEDFVQYIWDHADKYPEIDVSQNIMMQLVKLSEEQIRQTAIAIFEAEYPTESYQ